MDPEDNIYQAPKSDPIRPVESRSGYQYTKDPHLLTTIVVSLLGVMILTEVAAIVSNLAQLKLLSNPYYSGEEADQNDLRQQYVALAGLGVYILTAIPFLMWIHRAATNSRGFGAYHLTITPGWAVGWYFIPIANLFKPYQAMKEIWKVSKDPANWYSQRGAALLVAWWTLWITSSILGGISNRLPVATIPDLRSSTTFDIIIGFHSIALNIVALIMLRTIIRNQDKLVNYRPSS